MELTRPPVIWHTPDSFDDDETTRWLTAAGTNKGQPPSPPPRNLAGPKHRRTLRSLRPAMAPAALVAVIGANMWLVWQIW